jgi:hypothetical protein
MDISDSTLRSPAKSLHKLAQEKDFGLATAPKAFRVKLNRFPYKVTVFENRIKRVQACTDARGHHFQHLLISAQRLSERTLLSLISL